MGGLNIFDAPSVGAYLAQAGQGAGGPAHLLPQQTLDRVRVDVVQMDLGTPDHPRQLSQLYRAVRPIVGPGKLIEVTNTLLRVRQ